MLATQTGTAVVDGTFLAWVQGPGRFSPPRLSRRPGGECRLVDHKRSQIQRSNPWGEAYLL